MTTKRPPRPKIHLESSNGVASIDVRLTLEDDLHRWDVVRLTAAIESFMATAESCVMPVARDALGSDCEGQP